ncbi:MAG: Nif11-like leader peptide family natural product precursor [Coleofasciculus sp. C1-SOL-03]|jgi:predicted ribosomally synthesized peptide with nif11-like leader|uniref:Nif11-like leader peptide family natural product precursor n=1 Tax=Coleofasciculus sp. C1-SOL-03 TaxID=3069522 RepID=UPI0032FEC288
MSQDNVINLLEAGGKDKKLRAKYDALKTKEEFVEMAATDGYEFTVAELDAVLKEAGDSWEESGFPPRRLIWW